LYDNKILKTLVTNDTNIHSKQIIHHFAGDPGIYHNKIIDMNNFLNKLKDFTIIKNINKTKQYINDYLLPIIKNCDELLEGNIFMLHNTTDYTDEYLHKAKNICNLVLNKNIKNVMEIGFNSGFSSLLMLLSNHKLTITCLDVAYHSYTIPCYNKIKETFGDRINLTVGDSTRTIRTINDMFDLIHIDGGHFTEVADSDITNSYRLSKQGTILIMDDYNFHNLQPLWDKYIIKYNLQPLDIHLYKTDQHDVKYVIKGQPFTT
jgi:predicted O-methyltransferase YrrM